MTKRAYEPEFDALLLSARSRTRPTSRCPSWKRLSDSRRKSSSRPTGSRSRNRTTRSFSSARGASEPPRPTTSSGSCSFKDLSSQQDFRQVHFSAKSFAKSPPSLAKPFGQTSLFVQYLVLLTAKLTCKCHFWQNLVKLCSLLQKKVCSILGKIILPWYVLA